MKKQTIFTVWASIDISRGDYMEYAGFSFSMELAKKLAVKASKKKRMDADLSELECSINDYEIVEEKPDVLKDW